MSRCFPYPPPGFNRKKATDALIESIELRKDKEKVDKDRKKEKRREKNDKRREKKENREAAKLKPTKIAYDEKTQKDRTKLAELEGGYSCKRKQEVVEQLESSSVTEEHGHPLNLQNPSYSSDGTQNSNKRRKQASSATDSRGHGNIIRIRLPLQKQNESDVTVCKDQMCSTSGSNVQNKSSDVSSSNEQYCSTSSGRNKLHKQQIPCSSERTEQHYPGNDNVGRTNQGDVAFSVLGGDTSLQGLSSGTGCCSTSGNKGVRIPDYKQITCNSLSGSGSTSHDRKMQKQKLKYDDLTQTLYQITFPSELVDNDGEDWLFGSKCLDRTLDMRTEGNSDMEKRMLASSNVSSGSCKPYPCARYFQEAEMYALPYTVPF